MKITKELLKKHDICDVGLNWFRDKYQEEPELRTVIGDLMSIDRFEWANWLLIRVAAPESRVRIAVFCAEKVLRIFETKFPDDDRPRKAIQAARGYLDNKSAAAADAAYVYAIDAVDAINAAYDAVYAAAAADAADSAADAARTAYAVYADCSADSAADVTDAAYAAYAAYAAAYAAADAAYAVYAARAADAVDAAVDAARTAYAVYAAADDTIRTKLRNEIIEYSLKLIKEL